MAVYSGLYVDESENMKNGDNSGGGSYDDEDIDEDDELSSGKIRKSPSESEEFCISMRKFAIGVAIASLLLMFAVILLVICILQRRRRRNHYHRRLLFGSSGGGSGGSTLGSSHRDGVGSGSVYSVGGGGGPYTNRAYTRDW